MFGVSRKVGEEGEVWGLREARKGGEGWEKRWWWGVDV